jgi:hypothetical protein
MKYPRDIDVQLISEGRGGISLCEWIFGSHGGDVLRVNKVGGYYAQSHLGWRG